jgi:type IV secretion system protein VirB10
MADSMSPDASPTELGKRSGVRRVNNLPLYIIGTAFTMFLVIMVVVAMNRANRKNGRAGEQKQSANTSMYAKEIVRDYNEGLIPAKKSGPPAIPDQPQAALCVGRIPSPCCPRRVLDTRKESKTAGKLRCTKLKAKPP